MGGINSTLILQLDSWIWIWFWSEMIQMMEVKFLCNNCGIFQIGSESPRFWAQIRRNNAIEKPRRLSCGWIRFTFPFSLRQSKSDYWINSSLDSKLSAHFLSRLQIGQALEKCRRRKEKRPTAVKAMLRRPIFLTTTQLSTSLTSLPLRYTT